MAGRYAGRPVRARGGGIYPIEPGEAQIMAAVFEPQDYNVIFIPTALFRRLAEDQDLHGPMHFPFSPELVQDPPLFRALERLLSAVLAGESALEQQSRMTICMRGMFAHARRGLTPPRGSNAGLAVHQAMVYLNEHFQEPVDLGQLAAVAGLSGYYLLHAFRERTGLPPHAYLTRVRVEQARRRLASGQSPAEVAAEVGFADQSHLNRHFKRIWHLTPGQYAAGASRVAVFA